MIVFNFPGIGMLIVGGFLAAGAELLFGFRAEPPFMVVLGLAVLPMDVAYRLHLSRDSAPLRASLQTRARSMGLDWIRPTRGGSLFFVPVWALGALWLVLGAYRMIARH
jgi:hypothetical protein